MAVRRDNLISITARISLLDLKLFGEVDLPVMCSRGWVDPVSDLILFQGVSTGNQLRDILITRQVGHYTSETLGKTQILTYYSSPPLHYFLLPP